MKISLLQTPVTPNKQKNLDTAVQFIKEAKNQGAQMAVLPEMFTCPYQNDCFPRYAEPRGGETWQRMAQAARESAITLVAGSIPEREGDTLYNTSFVFDKQGREIARHRKVHLFDVDIKGGQRFFESDTFSPGKDLTLFEAEGHTFGLCICFDIRFPEWFRLMALSGAEAVVVPAAFNMTTGPLHWELSFRMRAVDNQIFTLGASPARDESAPYVSYANSIACSPWGPVLARAGEREEILTVCLDFDLVREARAQLPLLSSLQTPLYESLAKR